MRNSCEELERSVAPLVVAFYIAGHGSTPAAMWAATRAATRALALATARAAARGLAKLGEKVAEWGISAGVKLALKLSVKFVVMPLVTLVFGLGGPGPVSTAGAADALYGQSASGVNTTATNPLLRSPLALIPELRVSCTRGDASSSPGL